MQESCSRPGSAKGINSSPNNNVKDSARDTLSQQSGTLAERDQPNSISLKGREMSSSKIKCSAKSSMASHKISKHRDRSFCLSQQIGRWGCISPSGMGKRSNLTVEGWLWLNVRCSPSHFITPSHQLNTGKALWGLLSVHHTSSLPLPPHCLHFSNMGSLPRESAQHELLQHDSFPQATGLH